MKLSPQLQQRIVLWLTISMIVVAAGTAVAGDLTAAGFPTAAKYVLLGVTILGSIAGVLRLAYTQAIQSLSSETGAERPPVPVHPSNLPDPQAHP